MLSLDYIKQQLSHLALEEPLRPLSIQNILFCVLSYCVIVASFQVNSGMALPRMSLTAGTPCGGCHYSHNGGGGRTELGWSSMDQVGALTYDQIGLSGADKQNSNMIGKVVSVGLDLRVQGARLGRPVYQGDQNDPLVPDYIWIPMQFQPYLAVKPMDGLTVYGSVLPGPNTSEGDIASQVYPGMSAYEWWASYEFGARAPSVRIGKFQPTFGIRHDDHTILLRGDALNRRLPIIPPNFTEMGAEISYQPKRWVRAEVGGFHTQHLRAVFEARPEITSIAPYSVVSRLSFLPQFSFKGSFDEDDMGDDDFGDDFEDDFDEDFDDDDAGGGLPTVVNTWFGVSSYYSRDFHMLNGFVGAGINNGLSTVAEVSFRDNPNTGQKIFRQLNTLFGVSYAWREWLVLNARVERGQTENLTQTVDEVAVAWQYVAGVEFFPLPYIEIRPEYRLVDTFDYLFGQATMQVHIFY